MSELTPKLDSSRPNVAVIMSAYNVGNYIGQGMDSFYKDAYENKRLYIYNDASTDNTQEKILGHSKSTPYYYRDSVNKGLSFGRNFLIKKASDWADYFVILDGDDQFIGSQKITKMIDVALSAPTLIGVVYCDYENWNEKTDTVIREYKRGFSRRELCKECILSDSGTLVAKKAYELAGLYDETLRTAMDYDMWLRISEKMLIYHFPDCLTRVTIRCNSLSSCPDNRKVWKKNVERVYQKLAERQTS